MNFIPENIDALITAHLHREISDEQRAELMQWVDASEENRSHFHHMSRAHQLITPKETASTEKALQQWRTSIQSSEKHYGKWWFAAAAVVAAFGLFFYTLKESNEFQLATTDAPVSETLPDGTLISLAKQSRVSHTFSSSTNKHQYTLEGTATFDVRSHQQIQVLADQVTIEDIGTQFTVHNNATDSLITIEVTEGIVKCFDKDGHAIELHASQIGIYSKTQKIFYPIEKISVFEFNFNNTALKEVIKTLEYYYEKEIEISPELSDCAISVRFSDEPLSFILEVIATTLNAELKKENNTYYLRGNGCN